MKAKRYVVDWKRCSDLQWHGGTEKCGRKKARRILLDSKKLLGKTVRFKIRKVEG